MIPVIFIVSIAILLSAGIYMLSTRKADRKSQLLADLGLKHGIGAPLKSPFYKWGWRKVSDDRVWGERIVREAFEKQNIGLSNQDLEFFSKTCANFSSGGTVDKPSILTYIDKVLSRSSSVSNFATGFILPILQRCLSASPTQAQRLLERDNVQSSPSNAPDRLAIRQVVKMLRNHGTKIICSDAIGMDVRSESGETLISLRGFDSWEFWLKSCKESIDQCLNDKGLVKSNSQAKFLRSQFGAQINNYVAHLKDSKNFIKNMDKLLSQENLPKTKKDIETLEKTFYGWHFAEGIKFSLPNHKTLHDLISLPEFPSRFRQALLEYITPAYESLHALMARFPRHVIFMGSQPEARSYAAQQYLVHLNKLSKTISDITGMKKRSPLFLRVLEVDIQKARNPEPVDYDPELESIKNKEAREQEENVISGNTGHMPLLLDAQKRLVLFERNLDIHTAEKMGWIVDLPVEDLTPKEYAQLDLGNYLNYKRINCDKFGELSHDAEGKSAQFQRAKFLNSIFDSLLQESLISNLSPEISDEDE